MPGQTLIDGRQIKQLRDAKDWTQGELAYHAKVDQSLISRLEAGVSEDIRISTAQRIAKALDVTLSELLPGDRIASPGGPLSETLLPPTVSLEEFAQQFQAVVRRTPVLVPVTQKPAAAGFGIAEESVEYLAYWPKPEERNHTFIGVEVSGACLEPRIHSGDMVVVDTDASPRPGDFVVALHDSEILVKQLEQRNGDYYLVALRDRPPLKVNETTRIIGTVRWAGHDPYKE